MEMFFLNVYKEKGITSFDVIFKLRKILKIKKIGHSGTLDPLACGVMQVGVGYGAKLLDYLDGDKKYRAKIKFGFTSDTLDDESEKIFVKKPDFTRENLEEHLQKFLGKTQQIPPKYSAIKIGGKKLCDLARNNKEIPEIKPREIEIYQIKLENFNGFDEAEIFVHCSSGTYIRSLIRDLGENLDCGAYMSDLERVSAGNFDIKNSAKIDENILNHKINPIDVLNLNKYFLDENEYKKIKHGNPIKTNLTNSDKKYMLIYDNKLVSIANLYNDTLKVEKVFEVE